MAAYLKTFCHVFHIYRSGCRPDLLSKAFEFLYRDLPGFRNDAGLSETCSVWYTILYVMQHFESYVASKHDKKPVALRRARRGPKKDKKGDGKAYAAKRRKRNGVYNCLM
jgi:hypothetical protein